MSEETKRKLKRWVTGEVADKLEKAGLTLPIHIKEASKAELEDAGLTKAEISAVRKVLPEIK
jgi:prophage antirepressor-like protein